MKLIILTLAFLFSLDSISQIEIYNRSLKDSTKKIIIKPFTNELKVYGLKLNENSFIKTTHDSIPYRNGSFYYSGARGISDTLKLIQNGKIIHSEVFEYQSAGELVLTFDQPYDSIYIKEFLLDNPGLKIIFSNQNYVQKIKVHEFELEIVRKDTIPFICPNEINEKGNNILNCDDLECLTDQEFKYYQSKLFSPNQLKEISKMKSGDRLVLINAKYIPAGACLIFREFNWEVTIE